MNKTLIVFILVLLALVRSDGGDDDHAGGPPIQDGEGDHDRKENTQQNFHYEISNHSVRMSANTGHRNKWEYGIVFDSNVPQIYANSYGKQGSEDSKFRFRLFFAQIFSFVPSDTTVGFQEFKDSILNSSRIGASTVTDLTPANSNTKVFQVASNNGYLTLLVKVNLVNTSAGVLTLQPTDVKIDIVVNVAALETAGWLTNPNAQIGLKVSIGTPGNMGQDDRDNNKQRGVHINHTSGDLASFTWVNYVTCKNGSNSINVLASKFSNDNDTLIPFTSRKRDGGQDGHGDGHLYKIYFTLNQNANGVVGSGSCIWDPIVGFNGSSMLFVSLLLCLIVALFN